MPCSPKRSFHSLRREFRRLVWDQAARRTRLGTLVFFRWSRVLAAGIPRVGSPRSSGRRARSLGNSTKRSRQGRLRGRLQLGLAPHTDNTSEGSLRTERGLSEIVPPTSCRFFHKCG